MNQILQRLSLFVLFSVFAFMGASAADGVYIERSVENPLLIESGLVDFDHDDVYHLFTHGKSGELLIEGQWLSNESLASFIQTKISANTTHINIYGCNFAKGKKGKQAVSYLEAALGVSIAASDDITGVDGDWDLEFGTARHAISLSNYAYNLQETSGAQVSNNGIFSLTKSSDVSTVPSAGGPVEYTYTLTNLTGGRIYFVSGSDDKCSPVSVSSGLLTENVFGSLTRTVRYIPPGGTATWTCSSNISETTTNVATFQFAESYSYFPLLGIDFNNVGTATASVTVQRELPPGVDSCNTLWYSSDEISGYPDGTVGTLSTDGTATPSPVFDIQTQTGTSALEGSAAMAVDPANPQLIYFIPRDDLDAFNGFGGLHVYDITTGTTTVVSSNADTPDGVRLGIDPNGLVWTIDANGTAYSFDPSTGTWTNRGTIALPGFNWSDLGSGDLTFDGNGTMYVIGSDTNEAQLFTVTQTELLDGSPEAQYVGEMGPAQYNGIAFTEDGNLWASAVEGGVPNLYSIDIATGSASAGTPISTYFVTDLGSCALPKATLNAVKTVSPTTPVVVGDQLTFTIEVCNSGSLAATNTTFLDLIPAGSTYVPNSTTLNGVALSDGVGGIMPYETESPINSSGNNDGVIASGACATISFSVTVDDDFTGTSICNQGEVRFTNDGTVILTDDPAQPGGEDPTCAPVINPLINIVKSAPITEITSPESVTYTYEVVNAGNDVLTNVIVEDDKCSTVDYVSGDTNNDGKLQVDETWIYECTSLISANTTNVAIATGTGEVLGDVVTAEDTWTITVPAGTPSLDVVKTSSPTGLVEPGDVITYTIEVTNNGDVPTNNVIVDDALPDGVTYVDGSAEKTYFVQPATQTGTVTKNLTATNFNDGSFNQTISFSEADGIPVGATLTNVSFSIQGQSNAGGFLQSDAQRDDIELSLSYSGGTIEVDRGADADDNEFGPSSDGAWNNVTRSVSTSGTAIGDYVFTFFDTANQSANPENTLSGASTITITWEFIPPREETTDAANAPVNMVTTADAISLEPGESMTVTFDVTVAGNTTGELVNTATADADDTLGPVSDTAVNTLPNTTTAENDINQTPQDTPVDGNVLTNDTDEEGDNQSVQSATGLDATGAPVNIPLDGTPTPIYDEAGELAGTISMLPDGSYTFEPELGFTGEVPVEYVVVDDNGTPATDAATLSIEVIANPVPGNDAPVANDDTGSTEQNTPVDGALLSNDSDPDGDVLTVTEVLADTDGDGLVDDPITPGVDTPVFGTDEEGNVVPAGTITVNPDGTYTYTPDPDFTGEVPVDYTVEDPDGLSDDATLVITVEAEDPLNPINNTYANDDASSGALNETQAGSVLENDSDPEGDVQTVGLVDTNNDGTPDAAPAVGGTTVTLPSGGEVVIFPDGSYEYTPATDFVGTEELVYSVDDGNGGTDIATLYLTTSGAQVLPVELISFTAEAQGADAVLAWTTATEIDNSHFELEASATGLASDFVRIDIIESEAMNGNSQNEINYEYIDKLAAARGDIVYFRLKQVDHDGTETYTPVRVVNFEDIELVTVLYPNPAKNGETVTIYTEDRLIEKVEIYSFEGHLVKVVEELGDSKVTSIGTSDLLTGMYLVVVNGKTAMKLVVQ